MIYSGQGSPEGVVTGIPGALYQQTDGAVGSQLWQKQSGTAETGWEPFGTTSRVQIPESYVALAGSASTDDYDVDGISNLHFTVASAGTHTITGFDGGVNGQLLIITCEGGTVNLTHADSNSAAGNRLSNTFGTTVSLTAFQRAMFIYSSQASAWYELPLMPRNPTFPGLVTANAGLTVASGQTLTVTGATITGLTAASVGAGTFPSGAFVFQGAVSGITTLACTGNLTVNSKTTINATTGFIAVPENGGPANPQFHDADDNGFWTTIDSEDNAGISVFGQEAFTAASAGLGNVKIGFYGVTPQVRPTITGSRGGNAALANLLIALANNGLILDSTT